MGGRRHPRPRIYHHRTRVPVAASEGIVIQAQNHGKMKMWAQCIAVVALLVAAANGTPPVSNFGLDFPGIFRQGRRGPHCVFRSDSRSRSRPNDWKVFGYLVGRGSPLGGRHHLDLVDVRLLFQYFLRRTKTARRRIIDQANYCKPRPKLKEADRHCRSSFTILVKL